MMRYPLVLVILYMIYLTSIQIIINSKVCVKTNKAIWQGMVMRIPYSDMVCDANDLNVKWIENKTEDIVLIKKVSIEYVNEIAPLATQKYFCIARMEESVQDLTTQI